MAFAPRPAIAQNPVPFVNQPIVPDAVAPGGTATYTLNVTTVTGFNQPIAFGCIGVLAVRRLAESF